MTSLLSIVTPLTTGIIWTVRGNPNPQLAYYRDLDYILDGLITSSLKEMPHRGSSVLVGKNFGKQLFVLITDGENQSEIANYLSLVEPLLKAESDIVVLDDAGLYSSLESKFKKISSHLRKL